MRDTNKLVKMYMLRMFHKMNKPLAHSVLPQSLLKKFVSSTQKGGRIVAKSSMIAFQPSPILIRKSKIKAFGTVLKLRLLLSLIPNRVSPNAWVKAMAKTRKRINQVARRFPIFVKLAAAVLNS